MSTIVQKLAVASAIALVAAVFSGEGYAKIATNRLSANSVSSKALIDVSAVTVSAVQLPDGSTISFQ
jgi:hypothetical protein